METFIKDIIENLIDKATKSTPTENGRKIGQPLKKKIQKRKPWVIEKMRQNKRQLGIKEGKHTQKISKKGMNKRVKGKKRILPLFRTEFQND